MSNIDHADMVRVLAKSGVIIAEEMNGVNAHLLHMVVGVVGEAGELLEAYDVSISNMEPLDVENVLEELGDAEFYLEGLRQGLNITREATINSLLTTEEVFGQMNPIGSIASLKFTIQSANLLDLIKKVVIYQKEMPMDDIIFVLGKIEYLLDVVRSQNGLSHQDTLDANIAKLGKRYEGFKYSDDAAQTRADKA